MDFLTHSLIGAGVARLVCKDRGFLPQLSLAAVLGSLLPDADSGLALISQETYARCQWSKPWGRSIPASFSWGMMGWRRIDDRQHIVIAAKS